MKERAVENRAAEVHRIFIDCLFRDTEIVDGKVPDGAILVDGITGRFGLNPERVKQHDSEIQASLSGLPKEFYASGGGGMSFLNLCLDADGNQWGEHPDMQELCILAIASGKGQWCLPREMWAVLPGGMPYVSFSDIPA
jgi:hypothetical protein